MFLVRKTILSPLVNSGVSKTGLNDLAWSFVFRAAMRSADGQDKGGMFVVSGTGYETVSVDFPGGIALEDRPNNEAIFVYRTGTTLDGLFTVLLFGDCVDREQVPRPLVG